MKKIFLFLTVLLAFASCKDDITIPEESNVTKLVVYCFPSTRDTTWISVSQSLPVKQYRDSVNIKDVEDAVINYTVNGEQRAVTNYGSGYYYVVGKQKTGDKIALTVDAGNMPTATAETYIPDTVAVSNAHRRSISIYDDDWERSMPYEQLMASFTDPATSRDYYAVRIGLKYISGYGNAYNSEDASSEVFYNKFTWMQLESETIRDTGKPTYDPIVVYRKDSTYYYPDINTKSEPLLMSKTDIDDAFGFSDNYFGGMYIFDDTSLGNATYTMHLNYDVDKMGTGSYLETYERVELLHLTPEYYNFLKSINAIENSDLARYGLSQLMPTASNVHGGLGVVGGWNVSHTNWIKADDYEK